MLVRCVYASRAAMALDDSTLEQILKKSRVNNIERGVTGLLCYANDIFVQVLEGGRTSVTQLLHTIFNDKRHTGIELLSFESIGERHFEQWTMGEVRATKINPVLLLKYSEKAELNPFAMSGAATMALLNELAASGAIANRPN